MLDMERLIEDYRAAQRAARNARLRARLKAPRSQEETLSEFLHYASEVRRAAWQRAAEGTYAK